MSTTCIKRKPILTVNNRRNSDNCPEFLDTESLLERFMPLIRSLQKKFMAYNNVFLYSEDETDLYNQIVYEFLRLRQAYDPKRGVDFTGYIKFHLQQRVYHYVMKTHRVAVNEQMCKLSNPTDDDLNQFLENSPSLIDRETLNEIDRIDALYSIPWEVLSEEQSKLINQIILQQKSIEEIAHITHKSIFQLKKQVEELEEIIYNHNSKETKKCQIM